MKIDYSKTDAPKQRVRKIEDKSILKQIGNIGKPQLWFLEVHVFDAFYLPKETAKYGIRLSIMEETYLFNPLAAKSRNINFNRSTVLKCHTITSQIEELPDLFIYLVDDDNRNICFQRISSQTFFNNEDVMVIKLLPDPTIGKVTESALSGLVKIKIAMKNSQMNIPTTTNIPAAVVGSNAVEDEEEEEDDGIEAEQRRLKEKMQKKQEVKRTTYTIVANIHQSRYLVAGDRDGTSDPYVSLKIFDKEKKTSVKNDNLNSVNI